MAMAKKALIVWGGWKGHNPKECADLFRKVLTEAGCQVELADDLAVFADKDRLTAMDAIVPMWTMGQLGKEQAAGLSAAIKGGVGLAGFHGGMGDAFRENTEYQFMTGSQFVAHPGGKSPSYAVHIVNRDHEITKGVADFELKNTEQYYLHVDPSNDVLATTTFPNGVVMPAVYIRTWGQGRVFYASYGHTEKDFEVPEALEIVKRGILWAMR
jgi:type 1 glutamine amidotransferase